MTKLTEKQEKFCQKYIELGNASQAYRQSYNCENYTETSVTSNASKMLKNTDILLTIEKMKAEISKRHEITVDDLIKELEEARQVGKDKEQSAGMVAASMGKAKLLGLITDKAQLSGDKDNPVQHAGEVKLTLNVISAKTNGSTT